MKEDHVLQQSVEELLWLGNRREYYRYQAFERLDKHLAKTSMQIRPCFQNYFLNQTS